MPDEEGNGRRRSGPMGRSRRARLPTVGSVHDWDVHPRHASWLELFFDLVVVVAVANLGDLLHHDPSLGGAATFVGLLVPVWWAWISYSYFADLFDDDSPPHRLAQLAGMFGMIVLAVTLIDGVERDGHIFALAYGALFILLTAMYAIVGATEPRAAELCRWYTAGSALGAGLWLVSAAVPAPGRYVLWASPWSPTPPSRGRWPTPAWAASRRRCPTCPSGSGC